tara:strand:+ start:2257 stop:2448 length:192 start_codon:yes stop_codon:yes gene_type:complete
MITWEEKQGIRVKAPHHEGHREMALSNVCYELECAIKQYVAMRDFDPNKDIVFDVTLRVVAEE